MDLKVLAAAKSYTNNAIAGVGAIKGAPCQIQSVEDIEGGHRVTFLWIDNNSQSHTSTMDVMDGAEGPRGPQGHSFEIKGTYATASDLISAHPTGEAGDAYLVGSSTNYSLYTWANGSWVNNGQLQVIRETDRLFNIPLSSWTANSGQTSEDYPYIAQVSTDVYNDNSKPVWQMNGAGLIPTSTERDDINLVLEAIFNSTGITLYATDIPSGALVLEVKGE